MSEFARIARMVQHLGASVPGVRRGPGDDTAWIDPAGRTLVATTDAVCDGVHVLVAEHAPEAIGYKALAVNLSDVAAAGATPWVSLVTLGLPAGLPEDTAERIQRGIAECGREFGCAIAGGDLVRCATLFVSISVLGRVLAGPVPGRGGARPGDVLLVSGPLGGSILGRHLRPRPRLALGAALVGAGPPAAMMDLSDGLAGDLRHICEASGVGAELDGPAIPIHPDAVALSARSGRSALEHACTDGEDYELLLAASPSQLPALHAAARALGCTLAPVGRCTADRSIALRDAAGALAPFDWRGYEHAG